MRSQWVVSLLLCLSVLLLTVGVSLLHTHEESTPTSQEETCYPCKILEEKPAAAPVSPVIPTLVLLIVLCVLHLRALPQEAPIIRPVFPRAPPI